MRVLLSVAASAAIVCGSFVVGAGCGGSTNGSSNGQPIAQPEGGAADGGTIVADASPDAPVSDADQDPNVYPAKHAPIAQVDNLGGPLLTHPKLVTITFAGYTYKQSAIDFVHTIGSSDWWHATLGTYGVADAQSGGDFELPDTMTGNTLDENQLHQYLTQQVTSGALPAPDAQTLFILFLPRGAHITGPQNSTTCRQNGGYHNSVLMSVPSSTPDGGADAGDDAGVTVLDVPYAIVPDCGWGGLDAITVAGSHEIAEAVTDPTVLDGVTYYLFSNDAWIPVQGGTGIGGEVGDLCTAYSTTSGSYTVQRIWSNAAAAASKDPCQPATEIYFGAAVETKPTTVNGFQTLGHVLLRRGQSITLPGVFFSQAALPHDVTLSVGENQDYGLQDSFGPLPSGITATLSRTTAHNGQAFTLTFTADASAASGDSHVVVRSTLDAQTSQDWPLILNVR
jgi:hypothetical protein